MSDSHDSVNFSGREINGGFSKSLKYTSSTRW